MTMKQGAGTDYSHFEHSSSAHARLRCTVCHRRGNEAPQTIRPGHRPCSSCHSEKFASMKGPICTVCHTSAEPKGPELKSFTGLKTFNMKFSHARHANAGCATCHKPINRSVALSIPAGKSAHSTCNQCHGVGAQKGGRDLSSCDVCHQQGKYQRLPVSAKAYKINFSHGEHGSRQKLRCSDCHRVTAGVPPRRQMTKPLAAMHRASEGAQSCMSCHNNKRAFGGDDFSDCKRCHQGSTFRF
jgi:c(7)-type cytochrome triheme protein